MSDIHVLTGSRRRGTVTTRVAFHYAVPGGQQVANAALDPNLIAFVSAVPNIDGVEDAAIKAGEMVEAVDTVRHNHAAPDASVLAQARSQYTGGEAKTLNDYRARYWEYLEEYAEA